MTVAYIFCTRTILQIPKVYSYYKEVHALPLTLLYFFHYKAIFELFIKQQEHSWTNDTSTKVCFKTFKMSYD